MKPAASYAAFLVARETAWRQRGRYSPTVLADPAARLDFAHEFEIHVERARQIHGRGEEFDRLVETIARTVAVSRNCELVSATPAHVLEQVDVDELARYTAGFADADGHVVVFVNGHAGDGDATTFEASAQRWRSAIAERFPTHLRSHLTVLFHRYAVRAPIGAIRAAMTEGIAAALRRTGARDPVIVSQDVDRLATSERYATVVRRAFDDNPRLDALTGPVFYGHSPDGASFIPAALPDLLLGNRFLDAFNHATREGLTAGERFVNLEGLNTAVRVSALCAVGGYDETAVVDEDDLLSTVLAGMRAGGGTPVSRPEHVGYTDQMWLATDPRRQLRALLAGVTIRDSWRHEPFQEHLGAHMDTSALIDEYRRRSDVLGLDTVRRFLVGDADAHATVERAAAATVAKGLAAALFINGDGAASISRRFGLNDTPSRASARPERASALAPTGIIAPELRSALAALVDVRPGGPTVNETRST